MTSHSTGQQVAEHYFSHLNNIFGHCHKNVNLEKPDMVSA